MRMLLAGIVALAVLSATAGRPVDDSRPVEEFRIVPVRVHLLRSADAPAVNTKLKPEDIERIFRKANGIWHAAGMHLWVESVVDEKAVNTEARKDDIVLTLDSVRPLRPADSKAESVFHVYYVGALSVNGVYMNRDAIFVQEAARLTNVPGGIDEPLPRVTGHELGHAMGLPHRQDRTNLMASGTTGTSLNDAEIEKVRRTTDGIKWILSAEDFMKETSKLAADGKKAAATSRFQAIIDLPGKSTLKDQAETAMAQLKK